MRSAPLYLNGYHHGRYGLLALSRYSDASRELVNWRDPRSGRGTVEGVPLDGIEVPPIHDLHRRSVSGAFTPRRMTAIEPMARKFCGRALESLAEADSFTGDADPSAVRVNGREARLTRRPELLSDSQGLPPIRPYGGGGKAPSVFQVKPRVRIVLGQNCFGARRSER